MTREWRKVVEFNGYMVSSDGLIKSFKKYSNGYIMSQSDDKDGYKKVTLTSNGNEYTRRVHRMMAEAFLPNPENKPTVNHKNGIKYDNRIENLEWATVSENTQHAFDNGLIGKGKYHHNSKKYEVYKDNCLIACFDNTFKLVDSLKVSREYLHSCLKKNKLIHDVFKVINVEQFNNEINLNIELIPQDLTCENKLENPIAICDLNKNLISAYSSIKSCGEITSLNRRGITPRLKDGMIYKNKYYIKSISKYMFLMFPLEKRNIHI